MVKETQAETEERLKEERAIEIVDSIIAGYKKMFREELSSEALIAEIDAKIEEAKKGYIKHMLHNLCGTALDPEDFYRAKKMILARSAPDPVIVPEPIKPQLPTSNSSSNLLQQEETIARRRGRPRAK